MEGAMAEAEIVAAEPKAKRMSDGTAYLLLTLAMIAWSANIVVVRGIIEEVPPFALSIGRWVIALLAILPFVGRELYVKRQMIRRQWRLFLLLGFLVGTLTNGLTYLGATMSTAINAGLVNSAAPTLTLAVSYLLYRERVTWGQIQGIVLSSLGVITILAHGSLDVLAHLNFNWGDLLYFGAVCAWAFYSVLIRRVPPELSPAAFVSTLFMVGIVTFIPLHFLFQEKPFSAIPWTLEVAGAFLYMAFLPAIFSFVSWNAAVKVIGANRASPFNHLSPLVTTILAYLFLHEELALYHPVGAALIFAGIYLTGRKPSGAS